MFNFPDSDHCNRVKKLFPCPSIMHSDILKGNGAQGLQLISNGSGEKNVHTYNT